MATFWLLICFLLCFISELYFYRLEHPLNKSNRAEITPDGEGKKSGFAILKWLITVHNVRITKVDIKASVIYLRFDITL